MPISCNYVLQELALETAADLSVSHVRHFMANMALTFEVRMILADDEFENLARGEMRWEGVHLRVVLTVNDSKAMDKLIVSELFDKRTKIGCRYYRVSS